MKPENLIKGRNYLYFDKEIKYTDHTINQRVFVGITEPSKSYMLSENTVKAYVNEK